LRTVLNKHYTSNIYPWYLEDRDSGRVCQDIKGSADEEVNAEVKGIVYFEQLAVDDAGSQAIILSANTAWSHLPLF
jgi:hypothetical protein